MLGICGGQNGSHVQYSPSEALASGMRLLSGKLRRRRFDGVAAQTSRIGSTAALSERLKVLRCESCNFKLARLIADDFQSGSRQVDNRFSSPRPGPTACNKQCHLGSRYNEPGKPSWMGLASHEEQSKTNSASNSG